MASERIREGFYRIEFTGAKDWGMGVVALDNDAVIGIDIAGVRYDGTYAFNPRSGLLDAHVRLTVPPDVALVQGVPAQGREWTFDVDLSFPRNAVGTTVQVATPFGPVNVRLTFLRAFP